MKLNKLIMKTVNKLMVLSYLSVKVSCLMLMQAVEDPVKKIQSYLEVKI